VIPWYTPASRAVIAGAAALAVTFSADHSASLGFLSLGLFGVVSGSIITITALRATNRTVDVAVMLAQGAITVITGIVSLVLINGGLPFFILLVTSFAVITGALELYLGFRMRRHGVGHARDAVFVGAVTLGMAIAVLLVPPGFTQTISASDGVERQLTASVIVVGLAGAYWAILAVYLLIAGLSLKWSPELRNASPVEGRV
jgi:hypothetical protein